MDTGDKDKLGQVVPGGGARGRRFLPSPILQEANPVVCEALADGGRFFFGSVKKQQCKRHRAADFIRNLVGWTAASPTGCAPPLGPTTSEGRRGTSSQALGHPDPSDLCDLVLVFGSSLRPWSSLRRWYSDRLVTAGASAARMASWLAHHCCRHASSHPLHGHLACLKWWRSKFWCQRCILNTVYTYSHVYHVYDSININTFPQTSRPQLLNFSKGKTAEISGTISSLVFFLGALVASSVEIGARDRWRKYMATRVESS